MCSCYSPLPPFFSVSVRFIPTWRSAFEFDTHLFPAPSYSPGIFNLSVCGFFSLYALLLPCCALFFFFFSFVYVLCVSCGSPTQAFKFLWVLFFLYALKQLFIVFSLFCQVFFNMKRRQTSFSWLGIDNWFEKYECCFSCILVSQVNLTERSPSTPPSRGSTWSCERWEWVESIAELPTKKITTEICQYHKRTIPRSTSTTLSHDVAQSDRSHPQIDPPSGTPHRSP